MSKTLEIKMTQRGFEVTTGDQSHRFRNLEDALAFVHERLGRSQQLRQLSALIG